MDPLEPWIDASAVRRLAENLLASPREVTMDTEPDAGFGNDFVGFAGDRPRAVERVPVPAFQPAEPVAAMPPALIEEPPAKVFNPVEAAPQPQPVVPIAAPVVELPPAPPVEEPQVAKPSTPQERRGPLLERLARFRDLLIRHTSAQGVFILDREGKPVMEDPAFGKLHFLARSLAQAYRPVSGQAGNVHVKIGSNAVLEVVPVDTPFGCLVLGAVMPRPLTAAAVAEIASALRQAATPRETPS